MLAGMAGTSRSTTSGVYRRDLDQDQHGPASRMGAEGASTAGLAAYCARMDSLGLMPWQSPPCQAGLNDLNQPLGDARGRRESAELLKHLLDANLSPYEPDPLAALAEAERRQAAK
jgi:hypothetical protein